MNRMNRTENLSMVFQKIKQKQNTKRLSFVTQFKIEFLLPFTGYRKVLGKMPDWEGLVSLSVAIVMTQSIIQK